MTERRIAVTGAAGQLGRQIIRIFAAAGWRSMGLTHEVDITSPGLGQAIGKWRPDVVVNAAAWTDVDGCSRNPERAMRVNGEGAGLVARAASKVDALCVQISTNEVFDGLRQKWYAEEDEPGPVNAYGVSKLAGEEATVAANPRHLIVRTAWLFGPDGRNFPGKIIAVARRAAEAGSPIRVVADEIGNPTWTPDLAQGILLAVEAWLNGRLDFNVLHLAGEPPASRFAWAEAVLADVPALELVPIASADYPRPGRVPLHAVLSTQRGAALRIPRSDWLSATRAYVSKLPPVAV